MKDNFSTQSDKYLKFRPSYPNDLLKFLNETARFHETAWDCGTGNGQMARGLSPYFKHVFATDISEAQLMACQKADNITYQQEAAEKSSFPDNTFDLITVAQAIHWFNFKNFYNEVERTIKPGGILAIVGYGLLKIDGETDQAISKLYSDLLGPFWDKERKYIDENYQTIPFPYEEMLAPEFQNTYEWSFEQLIGYLQTWSAVKHFEKQKRENPVEQMYPELKKAWGAAAVKKVKFPLLLRVARINKRETH